MDLQKEQIIHHIADEIKKNIKQTISSKTDIDWGLYTGLLGMIIFLFYYARWTNKKMIYKLQIHFWNIILAMSL